MNRSVLTAILTGAALLLVGCTGGASARDADAQFQSGADRAPTPQTLYNAARLMVHQGRDEEAIWTLKRINRDYPDFSPAYCELAECHMRANRNGEAVAILNTGLKTVGDDPVLINNLGICAMMKSDYEGALKHFTKAATLAPGNVRYRANMAAALGRMGRYEESLALYQQVMPPVDANYNVGVLAESRGDKAKADSYFAEVARLEEVARHRGSQAHPAPTGTAVKSPAPSTTPATPAAAPESKPTTSKAAAPKA
ncbi:MAG TPA: tetratricopeptide repeat protein [Phycisphaerales bacterium]|nr:tetratricopeptide repeat protein [Phycisphaerales bacterium]